MSRSTAQGIVVVLVSIVAGAGLWGAGNSLHLGESLGEPYIQSSAAWQLSLCESTPAHACMQGQPNYTTALTFVPDNNVWVAVVTNGEVVVLSSNGSQVVGEINVGCPPYWYSPQVVLSEVYLTCRNQTDSSIVAFNATTLRVDRYFDLHSPGGCGLGLLVDEGRGLLYCPGGWTATGGYLRSMSLATGAVVENVTLRSPWAGNTPWVFDPRAASVIYADYSGSTVSVVDPSSGAQTNTVELGGPVKALGYNNLDGNVIALWENLSEAGANSSLAILDGATLAREPTANSPPLYPDGMLLDPTHRQVLAFAPNTLAFLNESTGSLEGSASTGPGPVPFAALDSRSGVLGGAGPLPDPSVTFANLTRAVSSTSPYSAIPLLGATLPLVVGGVGVLLGTAIVLLGRRKAAA